VLWSNVLLCRRRSVAARLILLNYTLLWRNVLLWSGVAAAAARRCRAGSAARPGLLRNVFVRGRLRNPRSTAAAPSGGLRRLLLRGSRRGLRRRRMPCSGRGSRSAGRTGRLLRRSAWRGGLRRRMPRCCDLWGGTWCRCLRSGRRTGGGRGVRGRSRARRGRRVRRGSCRATAPGRRSSSLLLRFRCGRRRHRGGNNETCRDPRTVPLEHGTTSCVARATQRASRRAGFIRARHMRATHSMTVCSESPPRLQETDRRSSSAHAVRARTHAEEERGCAWGRRDRWRCDAPRSMTPRFATAAFAASSGRGHQRIISVPAPWSVSSSSSTACGTLPSRMTTPSTPASSA